MEKPFLEMAARLGWRKRYGRFTFLPDAPDVSFSLTPAFPGCSDKLAERGIVWDLWSLLDSVRRPGAYFLLTCECGVACDAGIEEQVFVSHPEDATVVWELDRKGCSPALKGAGPDSEGFLRLVFERMAYESEVRAMLREVQQTVRTPVPVSELSEAWGFQHLAAEYPGCRFVSDYEFKPGMHGDCDAEEFCAMDADAEWPREPLFPPGTLIEVGMFGEELLRIDGRVRRGRIGRWITRWEAHAAFNRWTACFTRRCFLASGGDTAKGNRNEWVLPPGQDAENCHRLGAAFAETLNRCLSEGTTANGVEVRYVRCEVPHAC